METGSEAHSIPPHVSLRYEMPLRIRERMAAWRLDFRPLAYDNPKGPVTCVTVLSHLTKEVFDSGLRCDTIWRISVACCRPVT